MRGTSLALAIALQTLTAGLAVGAESAPVSAEAAQGRVSFNIEAQPLEDALNEFAAQTGLQVLFRSSVVRNQLAPRISGALTPETALQGLLTNTGLHYRFINPRTITISTEAPSTSLVDDELNRGVLRLSQSERIAGDQDDGSQTSQANGVLPSTEATKSGDSTLEEIVVTGTHIRGGVPVGSQVIEITRTDIRNSGFTSTTQLIGSLPQNFAGGGPQLVATQGAFAQEFSSYTGTTTASLRGLGDATLTLFDGHRLARTGGANGSDIGSIPLAAIERVEVLPDGASSIYGADAVAGVINVIPRKDYQGVEASIGLSNPTRSGGGLQQTYGLLGGTHWTGGSVLLSFTRQEQDDLLTQDRDFSRAAANPTTLFPQARSSAGTLYASQDVSDRLTLHANAIYNAQTSHSDLSYSSPFFSFESASPGRARRYTANAGATFRMGDSWRVGVDLNSSRDHRAQHLFYVFDSVTSRNSYSKSSNREYGAEMHADGELLPAPGGAMKGAFGAGLRREAYTLNFPLPAQAPFGVSDHRKDLYAYAEIEVPLVNPDSARTGLQSLTLSVSGRFDHYDDFGSTTNPRIGFDYGIVSSVHLRGSYGRSFRTPLLTQLVQAHTAYIFNAIDPSFPGGTAVALYESGGNSALQPETSKNWTATLAFATAPNRGLSASATYFSYDFSDKITAPITSDFFSLPLSDATIDPFVTFSPTAEEVSAVAAGAMQVDNLAGPGATLADVRAILDNRFQNIAVWKAHGADLRASYRMAVGAGSLDWAFNGTWLTARERPIPTSSPLRLSGVVFGPARVRLRSGLTWSLGPWTVAGYVNHMSDEHNRFVIPEQNVGSFTTCDLTLGYAAPSSSRDWLAGSRITLTALNLFDRDPPEVAFSSTTYPGIGYDSANASPFGRLLTLQVAKAWGAP